MNAEGEPRGPVDLRAVVKGEWLELEVGPGPKAGFLVERVEAAKEAGLVGLEIRRKWAAVGDGKLAKAGHAARARVFCEDARQALPRLGPDGVVKRVFMHFPDPWWKKRHEKRLVMGTTLLDSVARLLVPGGELYVQTDVEERAEQYEAQIVANPAFEPFGDVEGHGEGRLEGRFVEARERSPCMRRLELRDREGALVVSVAVGGPVAADEVLAELRRGRDVELHGAWAERGRGGDDECLPIVIEGPVGGLQLAGLAHSHLVDLEVEGMELETSCWLGELHVDVDHGVEPTSFEVHADRQPIGGRPNAGGEAIVVGHLVWIC